MSRDHQQAATQRNDPCSSPRLRRIHAPRDDQARHQRMGQRVLQRGARIFDECLGKQQRQQGPQRGQSPLRIAHNERHAHQCQCK